MAKKQKKRAKTQPKSKAKAKPRAQKKRRTEEAAEYAAAASSGGGGLMQSMRNGFKRAAGVGDEAEQTKESTLSKVLWALLIACALGYVIYKYTQ